MVRVYPYGAIEIGKEGCEPFKVNGQRLKLYIEGEHMEAVNVIHLDEFDTSSVTG